jgi:hypothetical protein
VAGAPTRHGNKRQKNCTLLRCTGSVTLSGSARANHFKFTGRLHGHKLKPGQYLLVAVATDTVKFTIVR